MICSVPFASASLFKLFTIDFKINLYIIVARGDTHMKDKIKIAMIKTGKQIKK